MMGNLFSRRLALSVVVAGTAVISASPAQACNDQPYMASVCMTAATFCPRGYAEANGQLLDISQYSALYALMGTTYGGDGVTSFALPDLRGRSAIGWGQGQGLTPVMQGEKRGMETVTLDVKNLPSHNHSAHAVNATGTSVAANNSWPANPASSDRTPIVYNGYADSGSQVTLNNGVVGMTGNNTPVNNLPPQLGMRYCVALEGIFPPRN